MCISFYLRTILLKWPNIINSFIYAEQNVISCRTNYLRTVFMAFETVCILLSWKAASVYTFSKYLCVHHKDEGDSWCHQSHTVTALSGRSSTTHLRQDWLITKRPAACGDVNWVIAWRFSLPFLVSILIGTSHIVWQNVVLLNYFSFTLQNPHNDSISCLHTLPLNFSRPPKLCV